MVQGSGFRVHGAGCMVQVAGFRVQGVGVGTSGRGVRVYLRAPWKRTCLVSGVGFSFPGFRGFFFGFSGFRVSGFRGFRGFGLRGFGFRVSGLGDKTPNRFGCTFGGKGRKKLIFADKQVLRKT